MALSASSSCRSLLSSTPDQPKVSTSGSHPQGLTPLPAKPTLGSGTGLRRKKSLKPVNASTRDAAAAPVKRSLGEEIATTSEEILDAVESVMEEPRRRNSGSKANSSRTSRRRALVMCLALGMVRPCASDVAHNEGLRRTVSEAVQRTASQMQVPLVSQVSLATTMKQTNFMGEPQDLQKLTTLQ